MTLIDKLRIVAEKLQWLKPISLILMVTAIALFGYIILADSGIAKDDKYLFPSVILLMWSTALSAFVHTFRHVPEQPDKALHGFFKRMKLRLARFYYYLIAIASIGLTLALVFASLRAFRV